MSQLAGLFSRARLSVVAGSAAEDASRVLAMHHLAVELVENAQTEAVWIDVVGSFQVFLLRDIICAHLDDVDDSRLEHVLDRVSLVRVFDATGLLQAVAELEESGRKPGLLVVDSMNAVYSPAMRNNQTKGHREMTSFLKKLTHITRAYKISTIVCLAY